MPGTSPNWYFAWQALSYLHSLDFLQAEPGLILTVVSAAFYYCLEGPPSHRGLGRDVLGEPRLSKVLLLGGGGVFSVPQGASPGPSCWAFEVLDFFPDDGTAEIPPLPGSIHQQ